MRQPMTPSWPEVEYKNLNGKDLGCLIIVC